MRILLTAVALLFSLSALATETTKDWTFLVYLNGHNNLDDFGAFNINEMEKVGSTDKVNVIVQWASLKNKKTPRLYIKKDNDPDNVTSPAVQTLGNVDMGDVNTLIDFIKWGVKNYPAKHYFVDIWNHGSGWHYQQSLDGKMISGGGFGAENISWDDNTGHSITTVQLGDAMKAAAKAIGHPVDIYGSDACLMAMPEISTQMAGSVSYYVGSEETEPGQGWPYTEILQDWTSMSSASPMDVSKIMVKEYVNSYLPNGSHNPSEVTFSAFDLGTVPTTAFLNAMKGLATSVKGLQPDQKAKIVDAVSQTQVFEYADYGDLSDFLNRLSAKDVGSKDLTAAIEAVKNASQGYIIANATTPAYQKAGGLSVWLPADKDTLNSFFDKYQQLDFTQITGWGAALQSLFP